MFILTRYTTGIRSKLIADTYNDWIKKDGLVLDAGCGDGLMSEILTKKFGLKITGCDIENYLKYNLPFKLMKNKVKLPFKDNSFDYVMFNDVLHHTKYEDQVKLILDALRVAKKVLIFEVEPTLIGKFSDFVINKFHNFKMDIRLTFRNRNEWEDIFKKNKIKSQFRASKKPLFYPFVHQAYLLNK